MNPFSEAAVSEEKQETGVMNTCLMKETEKKSEERVLNLYLSRPNRGASGAWGEQ
jgi:hypothetical protein